MIFTVFFFSILIKPLIKYVFLLMIILILLTQTLGLNKTCPKNVIKYSYHNTPLV